MRTVLILLLIALTLSLVGQVARIIDDATNEPVCERVTPDVTVCHD